MSNPNGPYPGRQLFVGLTADNRPCMAYLVTGRSTPSRERMAVTVSNTIRMGPLGDIPYDPLRHYTAVKYDNGTGVAAVSNGIQTEAVFETYKLLHNTTSPVDASYMAKIMDGAGAEPDAYHTPRIAGIVMAGGGTPLFILGITGYRKPAAAMVVDPVPGKLLGVATYKGDMEKPEAFSMADGLPSLNFEGGKPEALARYLYDISQASHKGEDIRVCAVGVIRSANKQSWDIAIINAYKK